MEKLNLYQPKQISSPRVSSARSRDPSPLQAKKPTITPEELEMLRENCSLSILNQD